MDGNNCHASQIETFRYPCLPLVVRCRNALGEASADVVAPQGDDGSRWVVARQCWGSSVLGAEAS